MSEFSNFLYAQPSFSGGMARCLDIGGTLDEYNRSLSGEQADFLALLADWRAVGLDLQHACKDFEQQTQGTAKGVKAIQGR